MVHVYMSTILPSLLVFLFVQHGIKKNYKQRLNFRFTSWKDLILQLSVCVLIFLLLSCNLIMWYELNKKWRNILLCFPIPCHAKRKPTWLSRVWWLATLVLYDITWKPSIGIKHHTQECSTSVLEISTKTFKPWSYGGNLFWGSFIWAYSVVLP